MTDPEISRLRWRCRRGMKELDMLLLSYVEQHYAEVGAVGQKTFRQLLSMPDPDILALLTGKATTDDEHLADVIKLLLTRD
jgi:antitoxin CptB